MNLQFFTGVEGIAAQVGGGIAVCLVAVRGDAALSVGHCEAQAEWPACLLLYHEPAAPAAAVIALLLSGGAASVVEGVDEYRGFTVG